MNLKNIRLAVIVCLLMLVGCSSPLPRLSDTECPRVPQYLIEPMPPLPSIPATGTEETEGKPAPTGMWPSGYPPQPFNMSAAAHGSTR